MGRLEDDNLRRLLGDDFGSVLDELPEGPEAGQPKAKIYPRDSEVDGYKIWTVEEKTGLLPQGVKARFTFSAGDVGLDWDLRSAEGILRWEANIPPALEPGKNGEEFYGAFIPLLFDGLPSRIDPIQKTRSDSRANAFYLGSTFVLAEPGKSEQSYNTSKKEELLQFAMDFGRAERVEKLKVAGSGNRSEKPMYILTVNYPKIGETVGSMSLEIPTVSGRTNLWGRFLMGWVLENHVDSHSLAEMKRAAVGLSNIMGELGTKRR